MLDRLPDANPLDLYWTIRMLVNRRNAIVKSITTLTNQLHGQFYNNYPSYKKFFCDVNSKTALVFWENYPSPEHLKGVTDEELAELLRKPSHNSCSIRKAREILEFIETDGDTFRDYQELRDFIIQSIVRDIGFKSEEIKKVEAEMEKLLKLLSYKLESIPGIDIVTATNLAAGIGDINRFHNADKLARFAGIAPVNFSSVGKTKVQALICVMRRLVNILYGMMKNKTEYVMPNVELKEAV